MQVNLQMTSRKAIVAWWKTERQMEELTTDFDQNKVTVRVKEKITEGRGKKVKNKNNDNNN